MQAARRFFSRATELVYAVGPAAPVVNEVPFAAYLEEVERRRLEARAATHAPRVLTPSRARTSHVALRG